MFLCDFSPILVRNCWSLQKQNIKLSSLLIQLFVCNWLKFRTNISQKRKLPVFLNWEKEMKLCCFQLVRSLFLLRSSSSFLIFPEIFNQNKVVILKKIIFWKKVKSFVTNICIHEFLENNSNNSLKRYN